MKNILRNKSIELMRILGIEDPAGGLDAVIDNIMAIKQENRRLNNIINSLNEESMYGMFQKLVSSEPYYAKNKDNIETVFSAVSLRDKKALMSVDIQNGNKSLQNIRSTITDRFKKMGLSHIFIEESFGKGVYILGFNNRVTVGNIIKLFSFTLEQLRRSEYQILVGFSNEFTDFSEAYGAYKEIQICRNYRRLSDKTSIMTVGNVSVGARLNLSVNFADELKTIILLADDQVVRDYLEKTFETNIHSNITVIKFEYLLEIINNTIMEMLSAVNKNEKDLFQTEQILSLIIKHFKNNFDIDSLITSYVNVIHFTRQNKKVKKSVLNRNEIIKYINIHYNEDLYLERLAAQFNTTAKYFSNYFKREFSVGFSEYLSKIRISHAKKILCETELPLSKVGEKVGYSNPVTFAVAFKKHVSMPPGKFRELNR